MSEPHRLQLHALEELHSNLGRSGRGVVVMPCGSGKTLLGRWFAEQIQARLTVVFVPSLALVPQTLLAYRSDTSWRHQSMIVCSDESSGRAVGLDDLDLPAWARESVTASTSTRAIGAFLAETGPAKLIVSTYHSAPRVAAALQGAGLTADLLVCDEAHRLTGRPRSEFRCVLDENALPARRRLFLTATPVEAAAWADDDEDVQAPLSLDDAETFGPTLYRATFADAVAAGRLVDYDVSVLAARAGTDETDVRSSVALLAVLSAADAGSQRILTFHSRVSHAKALATALDGHQLPDGRVIRAEHLQSTHRAARRQAALERLAATAPGTVRVVASARVLNEGVDVPAVDTVVFAEPRRSPVDIVQAVGRAMRTSSGKARGRVVLAATVAGELDEDTELSATVWRHVWVTLRALAEMDPRFATRLRDRVRNNGADVGGYRGGPVFGSGPGLDLTLPEGIDPGQWLLRALDRTGGTWWHRYELLKAHAAEHGTARPSSGIVRDGVELSRWVKYQRTAHRGGSLSLDRVESLQSLPGWAWDAREVAWWKAAEGWVRWHSRKRRPTDETERWLELAGVSAWGIDPPAHAYDSLAEFAVDTTSRRRRGELPTHLERAAGRLPGWKWDLLDDGDARMVDALAEYGAWQGDLNAEHGYHHDDELPLGAWLTAIRRRRVTSRLDPLLEYSLELLGRPSAVTALRWDTADTKWRLSYLALRQFVTREGVCAVPYLHVERLPDFEVNLSRWCTVQRQDRRRGLMAPERTASLEQVPGWRWEVDPARRDQATLEALATDPNIAHGTRAGRATGCLCQPCVDAHNEAYRGQNRHGAKVADLVATTQATRHLRTLVAAGVGRNALGRVSGLNDKTVDDVLDGKRGRIRPETAEAILAITLEKAREADRSGFGPHGEIVDAGPTWELLDWIIMRGWPKAWISREIGQDGRALQLKRDRISKANAEKVAELDRRLGRTRRPPTRGSNRNGTKPVLPTLDKLLALEEVAS